MNVRIMTAKEVGVNHKKRSSDGLNERIERLRKKLDLSQREFSDLIGIKQSTYSNMVGSRGSRPSGEVVIAVLQKTNVDPRWLIDGTGEMLLVDGFGADLHPSKQSPPGQVRESGQPYGGAALVRTPLYNVSAAAGAGREVAEEDKIDELVFTETFWERQLRMPRGLILALRVDGDSMHPTLGDGDVVVADLTQPRAWRDGIWVFNFEGVALIKRLQKLPANRLKVISDNAAYAPYEISAVDDEERLRLIGPILLAVRRL
jgi:phage repressor protein C with HTH and peptisase S24 domain